MENDMTTGLVSFTRALILELRRIGRRQMADRFDNALRSFQRYNGTSEVPWPDFTDMLLIGYEASLAGRGLCRNTTSYYMRTLRSIANRAAHCGHPVPLNPFRHVYTGIDRTVKRAVAIGTVRSLRDLDLSGKPHLDFARNLFLLSFLTRGMSFVDIAYLRKTDVAEGYITYARRKTRQTVTICLEPEIQALIDRLGPSNTGYLLPILSAEGPGSYAEYQTAYHRVNRNLQTVGVMLKLPVKLTLYVARHTWASVAQQCMVPLATISRAMGHDSENTTRIYLSDIDTAQVDAASRDIITLLNA